MHAFRAKDPRTDDIGEGMSQCQVTLDQAAHLMDAVAFGHIEGSLGDMIVFDRSVPHMLSTTWQILSLSLPIDSLYLFRLSMVVSFM